jgi:hypothetical protein
MIYPDYSIESRRCPICNSRLILKNTEVCKIYYCSSKSYRINNVSFPHYEFMRYKDNSVFFQYVIPPIRIMSQENESTVYFLKSLNKYTNDYSATELGTKNISMFLVNSNVDEIKSKIKMYALFS